MTLGCPKCRGDGYVLDVRPCKTGLRRRRECRRCQHRWTTLELPIEKMHWKPTRTHLAPTFYHSEPREFQKKPRWLRNEVATLRRVYPRQGPQPVADVLGRSVRAVYEKAALLGIARESE